MCHAVSRFGGRGQVHTCHDPRQLGGVTLGGGPEADYPPDDDTPRPAGIDRTPSLLALCACKSRCEAQLETPFCLLVRSSL